MPALDQDYAPRPWACGECKRILGVVMKGSDRIPRLFLFHHVKTSETMPSQELLFCRPRGLFYLHGLAYDTSVECLICGAITEWSITTASFERLMSHYNKVKESEVV